LAKTPTLALVGSESLMGREIRDLLSGNTLGQDLKLIAGEGEEAGKIIEQAGEPAVIVPIERGDLEAARVTFLAGSVESAQQVRKVAKQGSLIDLTYGSEDMPAARLRAPMGEPPEYQAPDGVVHVIANAASIAIAMVLTRLHAAEPIARSVAHILEPASERGLRGVEELQQQTIGLLTFKGQPKEIFDAQLAFNLLPKYGEEAPVALEDAEARIERHLATLLAHRGQPNLPSLRLIQAPVFHGYSISLWVEFAGKPGLANVAKALEGDDIDVRTADVEAPNAVGIAGQNGLAIGSITTDRNNPQGAWIWIVADNLRLRAENALAVASQLL